MKVMCIGQAAYDITIPVNEYPVENKKIRFDERIECGGGSSSNAAFLLSKWGLESSFAGVVGDDFYGSKIEEELKNIQVDTKYLEKINKKTTTSYIIANLSKGSRTILSNREKDIKLSLKPDIKDIDYIFLDGYEYDFAKKVIEDNPKAIKVIDAGSLKEKTIELAKLSDYIVCSKDFAEEFTSKKIDFTNLKTLIDIYDEIENKLKAKVIITLEEKGSFIKDDNYMIVPSIKVKTLDSTAAGDIFHAAFLYFLTQHISLKDSLRLANIAGALSVTKIGGRYSIPSLEEVKRVSDDNPL